MNEVTEQTKLEVEIQNGFNETRSGDPKTNTTGRTLQIISSSSDQRTTIGHHLTGVDLTFTDHKPKFLSNINSALRGSPAEDNNHNSRRRTNENGERTEILDPNRPAIPIRPGSSDDEDENGPQIVEEADDHTSLGRLSDEEPEQDEEAPLVVVVKEGRDLTHEEVEAERIRLRENPDQPSSLPASSRPTIQASLTFSSNSTAGPSTNKRKTERANLPVRGGDDTAADGWSELVKRTKGDKPSMVLTAQEEREKAKTRELQKKEKKAALKSKNKKAKNLMSFS
ncbi:uncharacterized protein MELLADRAFT_79205 [Melampsora larici-populina 98AG31]|uniref:DUF4604 domain-containing protein n=1 Tax=Melampsora larici-populina (strain 98AG31 / pathotype 3-4-7) TaxID=747676 RepID=F4S4B9_MELLP|nr:uncharacterized protein MELLADRAFT_79205 [Melampsora larici-populina 98AG31]EGG00582.1 hypothetical protein MELLADRAFT_79205 [Melampsora larici-populina 98AG31]